MAERLFGLNKVAEKRKVGEESKKAKQRTWSPSLAKGVDPPLICMTEALLARAVSCRIISMQFSSLLTEARRLVWPAEI